MFVVGAVGDLIRDDPSIVDVARYYFTQGEGFIVARAVVRSNVRWIFAFQVVWLVGYVTLKGEDVRVLVRRNYARYGVFDMGQGVPSYQLFCRVIFFKSFRGHAVRAVYFRKEGYAIFPRDNVGQRVEVGYERARPAGAGEANCSPRVEVF